MTNPILLHDNIRVQRRKWGNEFLAVTFREPEEHLPYTVSLCRYCVPGRIDSYMFDYVPGGCGIGDRIRFFSDTNETLASALKLVQSDLDKEQVVTLLIKTCADGKLRRHAITLAEQLISSIAPKSKALQAMRKAIKSKRAAEIAALQPATK